MTQAKPTRAWALAHPLIVALLATSTAIAQTSAPSAEQLNAEARAQRIYSTRLYLADLRRAEQVTYTLLQAASPYCVNLRRYSLGVPPISVGNIPKNLQRGYTELLEQQPEASRFMHVPAQSPLAQAGVKEGDILLSIIDQATHKAVNANWMLDRPANTLIQNEPINLEVQRGKNRVSLSATPLVICELQLKLSQSDDLIAQINASTLTISTGLLRFIPNNDELALLLANELIHQQIRAANAHKANVSPKKSVATPASRLQDEHEADYLSAYVTTTAGYQLEKARDVWRRIASLSPDKKKSGIALRHLPTAARNIHLASVSEEIRLLHLAGKRIVPNAHAIQDLTTSEFSTAAATNLTPPSTQNIAASQEDPKLQDLGNIPFISESGLAGYQRFLASPLRPRAFAIGRKDKGGSSWSSKFGVNATANALNHCATINRRPCYLYAVDDQVVWNAVTAEELPETTSLLAEDIPPMQTPTATGFAAIDDLASVPLPQAGLVKYKAFLEKPAPRVFIITESGMARYWLGPASQANALAHCERSTEPCWLYAVNEKVVWHTDPAKRISKASQLAPKKDEADFLAK